MEDRVVACTVEGGLFAAVYDGHSGHAAAEFCASRLLPSALALFGDGQYEEALSSAFSATNAAFLAEHATDDSGATACCVLLAHGQAARCHLDPAVRPVRPRRLASS